MNSTVFLGNGKYSCESSQSPPCFPPSWFLNVKVTCKERKQFPLSFKSQDLACVWRTRHAPHEGNKAAGKAGSYGCKTTSTLRPATAIPDTALGSGGKGPWKHLRSLRQGDRGPRDSVAGGSASVPEDRTPGTPQWGFGIPESRTKRGRLFPNSAGAGVAPAQPRR